MTDTTNTNELTEQSEKRQATPSLAELDLRDYFAAKAMAALIAEPVSEAWSGSACHWTRQLRMHTQMSGPDIVAHAAYMMADAMLRAREGGAMTNIITHCDNCGCDWLDNGLNPVGCPYCKHKGD